MSDRIKALIREPLLHFLALGALVFGLAALVGEFSGTDDDVIVVTAAKQSELALEFEERVGRAPDPSEIDSLVQRWADEEMLVREARAMGLHRTDPVVRRRLLKQMEFVGTHLEVIETPSDAVLREFWSSNPDRYRERDRFDVTLVSIQAERGKPSEAAAAEVLTRVQAGEDPKSVGHRLSTAKRMTLARAATTFGPALAEALMADPAGQWSSVEQDGQWFVFRPESAEGSQEGAPLPYARVEQRVLADWKEDRRMRALESLLDDLRDRYRVEREAKP